MPTHARPRDRARACRTRSVLAAGILSIMTLGVRAQEPAGRGDNQAGSDADGAGAPSVDGRGRRRRHRLGQLARDVPRRSADRRGLRSASRTTPTCAWARRASRQALLYAKLAGAKLYPSVDVLARGGGKMSGDGSGLTGGVLTVTWELDLWGRVQIRPRGGCGRRGFHASGLRVRPPVDCRARGQELVPGHRGRVAGRGRARDDSRQRGARATGRDALEDWRRQRRGRLRRPRLARKRPRQPAPDRAGARTGDSRAGDPPRPVPRSRGQSHAAAARPTGCGAGGTSLRAPRAPAGRASPPNGAWPQHSTASTKRKLPGSLRSR